MYKFRSIIGVTAIAMLLHFGAGIMQLVGNNGFTESHVKSIDQLIGEGPGRNMFVNVEGCVPGSAVRYRKENFDCTLVPVFRNVAEAKNGNRIQFLFWFDGQMSQADFNKLCANLKKDNSHITGMVKRELTDRGLVNAIEQTYPGRTIDARILDVGETPIVSQYYLMWLARALAYATGILGLLWVFRLYQAPQETRNQTGMLVFGVCISAVCFAAQIVHLFDVSTQVGMLGQIAIHVVTGIGLGCSFSGAAMLVMRKTFFRVNPFSQTEIVAKNSMLRITQGKQVREFPFEQIEAVGFTYSLLKKHESIGGPDYQLNLVSRGEKIAVKGRLETGQGKRIQSQVDMVVEHLTKLNLAKIQRNQVIAFEEWTISGDKLSIGNDSKGIKDVDLSQVTIVEQIDANYQIWIAGTDQHVAKLSIGALNSDVLHSILKQQIVLNQAKSKMAEAEPGDFSNANSKHDLAILNPVTRPGKAQPESSDRASNELGRVIYKDSNHVFGQVFALTILALLLAQGRLNAAGYLILVGVGITVGVVACFVKGFRSKQFHIHESGVSVEQKGKRTEIAYDDIRTFVFKSTNVYQSGWYSGTRYDFKFVGNSQNPCEPLKKINYLAFKKTDQFNKMKRIVAERVGLKIAAQLADAERVQWIPGCFIHKDGFEVPVRYGSNKTIEKVRWDRIHSWKLVEGKMLFRIDDDKTARIKISTSKPNFWPGYFVVKNLIELRCKELSSFETNVV